MLQRELLYAAIGTGCTCLATVLGAAMVFFFKKEMSSVTQKIFLGFAAGVMIAASVWSLLIPAMEAAEEAGGSVFLPVGGGFVLGGAFLLLLDRLLPHLHLDSDQPEGLPSHWKRTTMIVLAVTLHNIPEGMAVGLSFTVAAQDGGALAGAVASGHRHGTAEFPGGGGGVSAHALPGRFGGQGLCLRRRLRRGGAHLRPADGAGCRQCKRIDAVDFVIRRRRHDLRGGGGADSGGPPGGALPRRHRQRDDGFSCNDVAGHGSGLRMAAS